MTTRVQAVHKLVPLTRSGRSRPRQTKLSRWPGETVTNGPVSRRILQEPSRTDLFRILATSDDTIEAEREDSVLLFGSTGRVGRLVLNELLKSGRSVVAAVRSAGQFAEVADEMVGDVKMVDGVDMTKPETLSEELFSGIGQVVICTGASGIDPSMQITSEMFNVDSVGVINVAAAAEEFVEAVDDTRYIQPLDLEKGDTWSTYDSAELGLKSSISISHARDGQPGFLLEGSLVKSQFSSGKAYGFSGVWSPDISYDLTESDGIFLSVKGDGKTYNIHVQTADDEETSEEIIYVAAFDTVADRVSDVHLPFKAFRKTRKGYVDQNAVLTPGVITKLGFISSTDTAEELPTWKTQEGKFAFEVLSVSGYQAPRTQIVLLSSGGVERSARVGGDMEERNKDIPIMRLNPGGVMHHKYEAENVIRRCKLPYTIIRPAGFIPQSLVEGDANKPHLLQFSQGDVTPGRIRHIEVAQTVMQCLYRPEAFRTTFEVRRNPGNEAVGKEMTDKHFTRQFSLIAEGVIKVAYQTRFYLLERTIDEHRARMGLPAFPAPIPAEHSIAVGGRMVEETSSDIVEDVATQRAGLYAKREKELKK